MTREIWLHIGTPKSGTSALQAYAAGQTSHLAAHGVGYIAAPGRTNLNALAIAHRKGRLEARTGLIEALDHDIRSNPAPRLFLSSEMLYGLGPDQLRTLLPGIAGADLKILVYLRRQDRFIEAAFLQKSKNGRFTGDIARFIAKYEASGADYAAILSQFEGQPGITLVPRLYEADSLPGGDIVHDAMHCLGVPLAPDHAPAARNVTPDLARIQLLQLARGRGLDARRLQRHFARRLPAPRNGPVEVFSPEARRAFLARFEAGNEALRAHYFPQRDRLFDMDDLAELHPARPAYSEDQLAEIGALLDVVMAQSSRKQE